MTRIDSTSLYGTLNLLVLKALGDGSLHGLAIARRIHDVTSDTLRIEEGALYPALHRLERDGFVRSSWGISERRRRAKFYDLTSKGREHLRRELKSWVTHIRAVSKLLDISLAEVGVEAQ